jgi:hypothetical protein
MSRSAPIAVIILGSSLTASAQMPAGETVSVRGCVTRVQRDGTLSATGTARTATPDTASTEANSGETIEAFTLKDATTPVGQKKTTGRTEYALQGSGAELAKHLGHRVEITGSLLPSVAEVQAEKVTAAEGIRRVQVTRVKMIAAKCSATP